MNVERLKAIAERIVEKPESFYMEHWRIEDDSYTFRFPGQNCGTACCMAGHALDIAHEEGRRTSPYPELGSGGWVDSAMYELDLTRSQSTKLFLLQFWPGEYFREYTAARRRNDWAGAACAGAKRLKHFIETDGKE